MQRRQFLSASALSAFALPFITSLMGSKAIADELTTDNDDDYTEENGWKTLVNSGTLILKQKMLFTRPNGIVLDIHGKPVLDNAGNPKSDAIKIQMLRFSKNFPVGKHAHPEGELTYVLAGNFIQNTKKGIRLNYKVGNSVYMPPHSVHEAAVAGPVGTTIISFTPRNVINIK